MTFCIYKSHPCPRPTAGCLRAARHEMEVPGPYYDGAKDVIVSLVYEGKHIQAKVVKINREDEPARDGQAPEGRRAQRAAHIDVAFRDVGPGGRRGAPDAARRLALRDEELRVRRATGAAAQAGEND